MSGLDVYVESEVPMGSGLSSSAAVICAAAAAMAHDEFSPQQLVDVTIQAETEGVGAPTGGLDQTVSVLAEAGLALLLDFGSGQDRVAGRVHWHPESDGLGLLVVDTGVRHSHAGGGYGDRRAECEAAAEALGVALLAEATDADALPDPLRRRARHILTEVDRVRRFVAAVEAADWTAVGELFTASHASLRDDFEVSCPELDVVVDTANRSGALGRADDRRRVRRQRPRAGPDRGARSDRRRDHPRLRGRRLVRADIPARACECRSVGHPLTRRLTQPPTRRCSSCQVRSRSSRVVRQLPTASRSAARPLTLVWLR